MTTAPPTHKQRALTLEELTALFQQHLYLPDPAILKLVLATYVAAKLQRKHPVWLIVIGAPSGGKTSMFEVLGGLPKVVVAASVTEAGLLSRRATKDGPVFSGLLAETGSTEGLLVWKDLNSMFQREPRELRKVFAAFGEIYDGHWRRITGSNATAPIPWSGKLTVLGAATDGIEEHLPMFAQMGHRFFYYRLPENDEDERLVLGSVAAQNAQTGARTAELLKTETQRFLLNLKFDESGMDLEGSALLSLTLIADLATRCRAHVPTDFRGGVEMILSIEESPRMIAGLTTLIAALVVLGVPDDEIWSLVLEVALGGIPKVRRSVIDLLAANPSAEWTISQFGYELRIGEDAIKRVLNELHALELIEWTANSTLRASDLLAERWQQTQAQNLTKVRLTRKQRGAR